MAELFVYLSGALLTAGVYLLLQAGPVRMLFGVILVGNAVNLAIVALGRTASLIPPVIPPGAEAPPGAVANPLPQALVLTALVISFGLTAFALALVARLAETAEPAERTDTAPDPAEQVRADREPSEDRVGAA